MVTPVRSYPIFDLKTRANPQPVYEQMRQHDPIYRVVGPNSGHTLWLFTRYDDVNAVLKDQRFIKDVRKNLPPDMAQRYLPAEPDPIFDTINQHMLNLDAPEHTRLRSLVHKAFTPRRVQELQPRIHAIAADLLDAMSSKREADLIADFAQPLPLIVIAEMLGVDPADRGKFSDWTKAILFGLGQVDAQLSVMEFVQYMNEQIEVREREDKGDILSALVRAENEGDTMDRMELLSMIFLLLVAGHETTVNLIGNGTLLLLQHPDQMRQLQDDPTLIKTAIEEMLRYNGPVEAPTWRFASEAVEISGVTIPQGDVVLPSLLAANRDPDVFDDPNTFDITRNPNRHVAFGAGVHYCIGAPLARMEGSIAIQTLLERYPNLRLNAPLEHLMWTPSLLIHGLRSLPVAYG